MQSWESLCPYCGKIVLKDNARFCNHCGKQLTWVNRRLTTSGTDNQQQANVPLPRQQPQSTDSVLGRDIDTNQLVTLGQKQRQGGLYVIGKTRSGKTTLLVNLILQDIEQGMGVCFIDPHGDAINDILARLPSDREKDVILLDPFDDEYAFGLNLYQCDNPSDMKQAERTISYVGQIFEKLWGVDSANPSWGPRMAQVLRNTAITLIENQGMTMVEIPLLFYNEDARAKFIHNLINDQARTFWNYTYGRMKPNEQREFTDSTYNKIDEFLALKSIRHIVGQSTSTINFRKLIDSKPGKILLVKLSKDHSQMTSLIGAVLIGQLANAVYSRSDTPPDARIQFHLYADEYQRFATPDFAELLTEAGKFRIATTVGHQLRGQLDSKNRDATLNAANLVVYQVIGEDAEELAKQFDATPPPPEIIGWRPILAPKRNVLEHLLRNGHTNPTISQFTAMYLVSLTTRHTKQHLKPSHPLKRQKRHTLFLQSCSSCSLC